MRQNGPHLPDWINLILGLLLVISPWLFGFAATTSAMWNAVILGVIIAALSIAAISAYARWEEWVNALAGLWVLFSPWFLGFSGVASAAWTHFIIGIAVVVIAAIEIWLMSAQMPPPEEVRR